MTNPGSCKFEDEKALKGLAGRLKEFRGVLTIEQQLGYTTPRSTNGNFVVTG